MRVDPLLERLCTRGAKPTSPTLVVAAHADDETIGAGGLLGHIAEACWIVHVTDGAPLERRFYPASVTHLSRSAYARVRREEAERALALAGIQAARLTNLGVRDQDASFDMASLARAIEEVLGKVQPAIVITHPYEGGHPDHDATAFGVHAAVARRRAGSGDAPLLLAEMASYHDAGGTTVRAEFLPAKDRDEIVFELTDDERRRKRAMFAAFVTQKEVLAPFLSDRERFRVAPNYEFTAPPHDGRLHYERYGLGMAGPTWRAFARAATKKLGLKPGPR